MRIQKRLLEPVRVERVGLLERERPQSLWQATLVRRRCTLPGYFLDWLEANLRLNTTSKLLPAAVR